MTCISTAFVRLSLATVLGGAALMWSGALPLDSQSSFMSSAEARIGRPLTPLSYAGVARRTTRRAVVGGAVAAGAVAAGAYYAAPVVVAPACSQVVDVYGRVVTVCR
jgi:subtilisin family serine protease